MSVVKFYRYNDRLVVPTMAISGGLLVEVEPITIYDINEKGDVKRCILAAITAEPQEADYHSQQTDERPVVLAALGLKHWFELERSAILFTLQRATNMVTLHITGRGEDGYWKRDDTQTCFLSAEHSAEELAAKVASEICKRDPNVKPVRLLGGPPALPPS